MKKQSHIDVITVAMAVSYKCHLDFEDGHFAPVSHLKVQVIALLNPDEPCCSLL
jgi:pentose-5-phosphate-3-epimerase